VPPCLPFGSEALLSPRRRRSLSAAPAQSSASTVGQSAGVVVVGGGGGSGGGGVKLKSLSQQWAESFDVPGPLGKSGLKRCGGGGTPTPTQAARVLD